MLPVFAPPRPQPSAIHQKRNSRRWHRRQRRRLTTCRLRTTTSKLMPPPRPVGGDQRRRSSPLTWDLRGEDDERGREVEGTTSWTDAIVTSALGASWSIDIIIRRSSADEGLRRSGPMRSCTTRGRPVAFTCLPCGCCCAWVLRLRVGLEGATRWSCYVRGHRRTCGEQLTDDRCEQEAQALLDGWGQLQLKHGQGKEGSNLSAERGCRPRHERVLDL
ncbi:unnamed protein product [Ectocarpus sp. 6 AP-2014]